MPGKCAEILAEKHLSLIRELANSLSETLSIVSMEECVTEMTPAISRRWDIKDRANALIARAREACHD